MIKTKDYRKYRLIVTQLLHDTIYTFDSGRVYYLNRVGLHLSDLKNNITIIGRPHPEKDSLKVLLLPDGMTFSMWLNECRIMEIVSEELGIKDYPRNATEITIKKITEGT